VTMGEFGSFNPSGAVKTSTGYEVAFSSNNTQPSVNNTYTIWNTDANGNFISTQLGAVSGASVALESAETTFQQDLNGDHVIGVVSGGTQSAQAGASRSDTTSAVTISGNTLEVPNGGALQSGAVAFAPGAGGTLQLDDSAHFGGVVSGF